MASVAIPDVGTGDVRINVVDEARGSKSTFVCDRALLAVSMRYFADHLARRANEDDVSITVHSDLEIFEWLIEYVKSRRGTLLGTGTGGGGDGGGDGVGGDGSSPPPPALSIDHVVSILVSSNFLRMDALIGECLEFIAANYREIVVLPLDFSCIDETLLERLARQFTPAMLAGIASADHRLTGRLFMKAIEQLLDGTVLKYCRLCRTVIAHEHVANLPCPRGREKVSFHGDLVVEHSLRRDWDPETFLERLVGAGLAWPDMYWYFYGLTAPPLACAVCGVPFALSASGECRFHTEAPMVAHDGEIRFPCCDAPGTTLSTTLVTSDPARGCATRFHRLAVGVPPSHLGAMESFGALCAAASDEVQRALQRWKDEPSNRSLRDAYSMDSEDGDGAGRSPSLDSYYTDYSDVSDDLESDWKQNATWTQKFAQRDMDASKMDALLSSLASRRAPRKDRSSDDHSRRSLGRASSASSIKRGARGTRDTHTSRDGVRRLGRSGGDGDGQGRRR